MGWVGVTESEKAKTFLVELRPSEYKKSRFQRRSPNQKIEDPNGPEIENFTGRRQKGRFREDQKTQKIENLIDRILIGRVPKSRITKLPQKSEYQKVESFWSYYSKTADLKAEFERECRKTRRSRTHKVEQLEARSFLSNYSKDRIVKGRKINKPIEIPTPNGQNFGYEKKAEAGSHGPNIALIRHTATQRNVSFCPGWPSFVQVTLFYPGFPKSNSTPKFSSDFTELSISLCGTYTLSLARRSNQ